VIEKEEILQLKQQLLLHLLRVKLLRELHFLVVTGLHEQWPFLIESEPFLDHYE
jgi:hypothetical protein